MNIELLGTTIVAREIAPTLKHRLAIAPGLFGTVYGINRAGEARYFDYDRQAAYAFAGITAESDVRFARARYPRSNYIRSGSTEAEPRMKRCLWVTDPA